MSSPSAEHVHDHDRSRVRFCAYCGAGVEYREIEHKQRPVCTGCGAVHYRNPAPVAAVAVEMDGGIVVIRRRYEPGKGGLALPAGYQDHDETIQQAAVREVLEETHLQVRLRDLLGVYSYLDPVKPGLVVAFRATVEGGQLTAGDDAEEALVCGLDDFPELFFESHRLAMEDYRRKVIGDRD